MNLTTLMLIEKRLNLLLSDYQMTAVEWASHNTDNKNSLLFYKTGAGKSITALAMLFAQNYFRALVIAPPSTHPSWMETAAKLGMNVTCVSHAKFRQKGFKLDRNTPVIADEFHMFGGHTGKGWTKFDRLAYGLKAPAILASATPNYNDAERVYCIEHALDADRCRGGYLAFLHANCLTEFDPFSQIPKVTGFINYKDAAEYLSALPNVFYLADDLVYTIDEVDIPKPKMRELDEWGLNTMAGRMIASSMEERHYRAFRNVCFTVDDVRSLVTGTLDTIITNRLSLGASVLIYCNHETIASAMWRRLALNWKHELVTLVTGKTSSKDKDQNIYMFNSGQSRIMVGTASLATGTDGMDKVCDTLIIVDDTDDDALRRQLIGRIMPRGINPGSSASKRVIRFEYT